MIIRQPVTPVVYPSTLPCPLVSGYGVSYDRLLSSAIMQSGFNTRRRREPYTFRTAQLVFRMASDQFPVWHDFVNANAFKWISIPLMSDWTQEKSEPFTQYQTLRFASSVNWAYADWNLIEASVQVEFFLDATDTDASDNINTPIIGAPDHGVDEEGDLDPNVPGTDAPGPTPDFPFYVEEEVKYNEAMKIHQNRWVIFAQKQIPGNWVSADSNGFYGGPKGIRPTLEHLANSNKVTFYVQSSGGTSTNTPGAPNVNFNTEVFSQSDFPLKMWMSVSAAEVFTLGTRDGKASDMSSDPDSHWIVKFGVTTRDGRKYEGVHYLETNMGLSTIRTVDWIEFTRFGYLPHGKDDHINGPNPEGSYVNGVKVAP